MKPDIKKDHIFISVAAYRDPVCTSTLKSMFENASDPSKVFAGICQQNKEDEDEDCQKGLENSSNVRTIRLPHYQARGPTWARYLCSTLWNGEEYFMQIDSHTKFVKDWDKKCIKMLNDIIASGESKKPIISHYPREITDHDNFKESDKHWVPKMCKAFWNNRDMVSFLGAETQDTKGKCSRHAYLAGGMIFSKYDFLKDVPYDPLLPYLFVGEEILHSMRAYTHGFDVFNPSENIVFHEYTRASKPKIWTDDPYYSDIPAFEKVKYYIGLSPDDSKLSKEVKVNLDKYGMGKERTIDQFYEFTGIDKKEKKVTSNFCRDGFKATEEDIKQSNEKNHKKENFLFLKDTKYTEVEQWFFFVFALFVLVLIIWIFAH